jgi:hypothetical protein
MGWKAPGLTCKAKSGAASLANMRPRDFIFFAAYALAGLVPPLPSFFLTPLVYYGLQLQHLSPNSIAQVASPRPPLIGVHYFQRRTPGHAHYIAPVSPGRWERWREDWALVQADVHDWLALPVGGLTLDRTEWGKDPDLESGFDPVLDQIQYLAENGLTSLVVAAAGPVASTPSGPAIDVSNSGGGGCCRTCRQLQGAGLTPFAWVGCPSCRLPQSSFQHSIRNRG